MFFFKFSTEAGEGNDQASDSDGLFSASFYERADTVCIATHIHIALG